MMNSNIEDLLFEKLKASQKGNKKRHEEHNHSEPKCKKKNTKKNTSVPTLSDILGTSESSKSIDQYDAQRKMSHHKSNEDERFSQPISGDINHNINIEKENKINYYQSDGTNEQQQLHYDTQTRSTVDENSERIIQFKSNLRHHELVYFVADTNFLIDNLLVIEMMEKIETHFLNKNRSFLKICVIDTVLSELDHLKQRRRRSVGNEKSVDDKTQDIKMKAIKANRYIYDKITTTDTGPADKNKVLHVLSRANLRKEIKQYSKQLEVKYDFQDDYSYNNDDKILNSSLTLQEVLELKHDADSDFEFIKEQDFIKYSLLPTSSVVVLTNDKNFCIKLISSDLKTISLKPEENRTEKELLVNTKVLILKCLQEQIKSLVINWQNMIILNLFETFLLDPTLNNKILDAYNYLLNDSHGVAVSDIQYIKETSHLFAVNNISKSGIDELLDKAPDLKLIFSILNKVVVSFQTASCQTMNFLGVYNIDYNTVLELVNILFFNDTESLLNLFIGQLIELVKKDYGKGKIASEIELVLNFNGYLRNMNKVSESWRLYLISLADGIESVFITNFKLKLDVMWKEIVDLLGDLLFLSELSLEDFDL